jgi:DNA primase
MIPADAGQRITEQEHSREIVPASFRRQIEALKDAVRIEDVAAGYGAFRLMGAGRLLGRCVAPDHEDRTPSMTVYTDAQRFKCYGCGAGGDVIDLVRLAEGGEAWEAMVSLSTRHGVELPGRSAAWYARQRRQAPMRSKIEDVRAQVMMRRLFRWVFEPMLASIEDEDERASMGAYVWADVLPLAVRMAEDRRGAE